MKRRPADSNTEGKKDTGMLKYIRNQVNCCLDAVRAACKRLPVERPLRSSQVMSLSPAPLSLLIKAAPILTDDMYGDIQPAAWELLLSVDEHMAAAAGESATWECPLWDAVKAYMKNCIYLASSELSSRSVHNISESKSESETVLLPGMFTQTRNFFWRKVQHLDIWT